MNKVTAWDYDASVKRVMPKVMRLKELTLDVYQELWTAREQLSNQGARTDITSGQMSRSWESYCEDVGLVKRTVNRWLQGYDPVKQQLIEAPRKEKRTTATVSKEEVRQAQENANRRFKEHMQQHFEEDQRLKDEAKREAMQDLIDEAKRYLGDSFEERRAFALSDRTEAQTQDALMDITRRYLATLESDSRRLEVIHNQIKWLRTLAAEYQRASA